MRLSKFLLATVKETPADAEVISHQLMLRAGMIRRLAAGLYTWLPMGLRVLRKVEAIIREEMNRAGAQEVLMPAIQPAELWQESDRWDRYGPELLRLKDRHDRDFCFGPTHEEIITDLIRRELRSYKQVPVNFYQIQTKFRDEIRPRFGVMRAREFIMKDAYSFHMNQESLQDTYNTMFQTYSRIFTRLGLKFRAVRADSGAIGGNYSHEFHVLADSGEDIIAFSDRSDYASNIELAPAPAPKEPRPDATEDLATVDTPGKRSIEEVSQFLGVKPEQCVKTLLVKADDGENLVALVIRGDHELNTVKAEKLDRVHSPFELAPPEIIKKHIGCDPGSLGPVNLNIPIIVDYSAANLANFICGANKDGKHLTGVNWQRDLNEPVTADLRHVVSGDPSPDGNGQLRLQRGIEVGHIFQLGTKYSEKMNATVLDDQGRSTTLTMGCYGIGVTRIVAAAIEQNNDHRGILWPQPIAPFDVALIPVNMYKSQRLKNVVEDLYTKLQSDGIDVMLDDRKERIGVMFANADLIGVPHRLVINEKHIDEGNIEYKKRDEPDNKILPLDNIVNHLKEQLEKAD